MGEGGNAAACTGKGYKFCKLSWRLNYESIYFKQKCFMFSLCLSNDDSYEKKKPKPDQLGTGVLLFKKLT